MASKSKIIAELSVDGNTETGFIDLPGGTTAQRPSPAGTGNLRFNTTTGLAEYYNGNNVWQAIDTPPGISSVSPTGAAPDNTSASFVITGQNFQTGATASIVSSSNVTTNATTTTLDSSTQITAVFNTTGLTAGSYTLKVTNASGLSGELASGVAISNSPVWTTSAGNIATFYSDRTGSVTVAATDAEGDTVSFALESGSSLYGGLSLNGSTGVISGDPTPDISAGGASSTNTFTLEATDGTTTVPRTFNIIISEPLGTATNPATSAAQLYDAGYQTDGAYYINNIYTGSSAVNSYCRFDINGKHFQKIDPRNFAGYSGPRYYYSNGGTPQITYTSNIHLDGSAGPASTTGNHYYDTGSSTSQGASAIFDTGFTKNTLDGHSWAGYTYISASTDGYTQGKRIMLDWASSGGTNYGHQYSGDYDMGPHGTDGYDQSSAGSAMLGIVTFNASSSTTITGSAWSNNGGRTYNQMWEDADDGSLGAGLANSGNISATDVFGVRITGWTDAGSGSNYWWGLWAHIPSS